MVHLVHHLIPIFLVTAMAGYALAAGPAADLAPPATVTPERIAAGALAVLLVVGLARLRRDR